MIVALTLKNGSFTARTGAQPRRMRIALRGASGGVRVVNGEGHSTIQIGSSTVCTSRTRGRKAPKTPHVPDPSSPHRHWRPSRQESAGCMVESCVRPPQRDTRAAPDAVPSPSLPTFTWCRRMGAVEHFGRRVTSIAPAVSHKDMHARKIDTKRRQCSPIPTFIPLAAWRSRLQLGCGTTHLPHRRLPLERLLLSVNLKD